MLTTTWLLQGQAMAVTVETTAATATAQALQAQAAAVLTAQGQQAVPGMTQLIQALQNIVPAVAPAAQPAMGPAQIKMALPKADVRTTKEAKQFLQPCKNYFTLNAMNAQQRILFTLQLIKGDAAHWRHTLLTVLDQPTPPPWMNDWVLGVELLERVSRWNPSRHKPSTTGAHPGMSGRFGNSLDSAISTEDSFGTLQRLPNPSMISPRLTTNGTGKASLPVPEGPHCHCPHPYTCRS
jgi:hypothetical protein